MKAQYDKKENQNQFNTRPVAFLAKHAGGAVFALHLFHSLDFLPLVLLASLPPLSLFIIIIILLWLFFFFFFLLRFLFPPSFLFWHNFFFWLFIFRSWMIFSFLRFRISFWRDIIIRAWFFALTLTAFSPSFGSSPSTWLRFRFRCLFAFLGRPRNIIFLRRFLKLVWVCVLSPSSNCARWSSTAFGLLALLK